MKPDTQSFHHAAIIVVGIIFLLSVIYMFDGSGDGMGSEETAKMTAREAHLK